MTRPKSRRTPVVVDPLTLVNMARVEPAAAMYILDRRKRGVPAEGKWTRWNR